jgi:glycerol-3-phosphate O-acyltransferase
LQIGTILTADEIRKELELEPAGELHAAKRRAVVTRLGNRVMDEINRVTAVTPGALTALSLLTHGRRGLSHEELIDRARKLLGVMQKLDVRATPTVQTASGALRPEAIREAAQMYIEAELIEAHFPEEAEARRAPGSEAGDGAIYTVLESKRLALDSSKNIVVHFFVERALVAIALLVPPGPPVNLQIVRDRVQKLSRLFKYEFRFRADAPFDEIFAQTIGALIKSGKVAAEGENLIAGPGVDGWTGREWLEVYASILTNFVEGYRVAARGLSALVKSSLTEKDLIKRMLTIGNRMFYAGEIARREAVSKPLMQNALRSFIDQGYVLQRDGKLELAEAFRNAKAVRAIESRIRGFLEEVRE